MTDNNSNPLNTAPQVAQNNNDSDQGTGTAGPDELRGLDGNDLLRGLGGNDTLNGGAGNDILDGGAGADVLDGGEGVDTVRYKFAQAGVVVSLASGRGREGEAAGDRLTNIENLWGSEHDDRLTGNNGDNVLNGSGGDDILNGRSGNDLLDSGAGDDALYGGPGADTLNGGAGVDTANYVGSSEAVAVSLAVGSGTTGDAAGDTLTGIENLVGSDHDDILFGSDGANRLMGFDGNDRLSGEGGDDVLSAGAGADMLDGGTGNDRLSGERGDDVLSAGAGADTLDGGTGSDLLDGGAGADVLDGGAGVDTALYAFAHAGVAVSLATGSGTAGDAAGDTLTGIENLVGSDHGDRLFGNAGANRLVGGAGDDALYGGADEDTLDGGSGVDTAVYAGATAGVAVSLATGSGTAGDAAGDTLIGIENLGGSDHADTLHGNNGANWLSGEGGDDDLDGGAGDDDLDGGAGDDDLDGGAGDDDLDGGAGDDDLDGGAGDDDLDGGAGDDELDGGAGDDELDGGAGDDELIGGSGADSLVGGDGVDTALYSGAAGAVTVNLKTGAGTQGEAAGDTLTGIENLHGSGHDDIFFGNDGANRLTGFGGDDTLGGGAGADTLGGGAGDDALAGGLGDDSLRGGGGGDTLDGGAGADTLIGGPGADSLVGGDGVDTAVYIGVAGAVTVNLKTGAGMQGEAAGDTLTGIENLHGSGHDDIFFGNDGANWLISFGGNDRLSGEGGDDTLFAGAGADMLNGGTGNDRLSGDGGDDVLVAGAGADTLNGGTGNDLLDGGAGADVLDGGAGVDTALYAFAQAGIAVSLATGSGTAGEAAGDTLTNIENLLGSEHDDTLTGNNGNNVLDGSGGDDILEGMAGNDTLEGDMGDDTFVIAPGGGSDTITDFDADNDLLVFKVGLFANFEAVRNAATETSEGDLQIELSDTEILTVLGVSLDDLTRDNVEVKVNTAPTGEVTISGTVREGETLTAETGTLGDNDGLGAFSYQWQRSTDSGGFEDIPNATDQSYTLIDADSGQTLRVQVSYTDGQGTDETLTSAATAAVTNATGVVRISGTVTKGETLIAQTGTLGDADGLGALSYQWQRSDGQGGFDDIAYAASRTYTLGNADVGRTVQVEVSYTDGQGTAESVTSDATAAVTNANNAPTGGVRIDGTVRQGQTLSVDSSALRDTDGLPNANSFTYQWQRTGTDGTFADIENATEQTYTLGADDAGQRLQVEVRYIDGNGTEETVSAATVSAAASSANDPVPVEIINGSSSNQYLPAPHGDVSQRINGGGGNDVLQGRGGADILDGGPGIDLASYFSHRTAIEIDLETGTGKGGDAEGDVLLNIENVTSGTGNDRITGNNVDNRLSGREGNDTLTGGAGNDVFDFAPGDGSDIITDFGTGSDRLKFLEGLFVNLQAVRDAASQSGNNLQIRLSNTETLTLENASLANLTADTVTTLDDDGKDTTNSNSVPRGAVRISGSVTEDAVLTAQTDTLGDADGLGALSYQWQRNTGPNNAFEAIAGETGETYTLGDADVGQTLRVQVSYTDGQGTAETVTSAATTAVINVNDQPTGSVTISGTVTKGETLTAQNTLADNDGLGALSYQWQRSDDQGNLANIAGETGGTYTLRDADVGRTVQVQVSYTDGQGTAESVTSAATNAVTNANNAPTGGVRIDGTVRQGQTLSVDSSALRDTDGLPNANSFTYQWQRTGTDGTFADIENATEQTYTLGADDAGQRLQVEVRYIDGNGTEETVSAATVSAAASSDNDPVPVEIINGNSRNIVQSEWLPAPHGDSSQRINGNNGNDVLQGRGGADILDGGSGTDTASYYNHSRAVEINLETGTGKGGDAEGDVLLNIENVMGGRGNDRLTGNNVDNRLRGRQGNDTLNGGAGDDTLEGVEGNDILIGGAGNDTLEGGAGNDVFRFAAGSDTITDFGTGTDRLVFEGGLFANLEAVQASAHETADGNLAIRVSPTETLTLENTTAAALTPDAVMTLSADGVDTTTATAAFYIFYGPDGQPTGVQRAGTAAADSLETVGSNDLLRGLGGNDTLEGFGGNDTLNGGTGNDLLDGGAGADVLDGGEGVDTALYAFAQAGVTVSLENGTGTAGEAAGDRFTNIENLWGSEHDDTLTGNNGDNVLNGSGGDDILNGRGGNDVLVGGLGTDTLNGGTGNDILDGGVGADVLDGGEGVDTASYLSTVSAVAASLGSGTGTEGDAAGDSFINIENLEGGGGSDTLTGNNGDNVLDGSGGDDILEGMAGNDTLEGGVGDDTFVITSGAGSDIITDFDADNDRLVFEVELFANFEAVRNAATETNEGDLQIELSDTEMLTVLNASLDDLTRDNVKVNVNAAPTGSVTISAVPVEPGDANTTDTVFGFTIDGQRGNGLGLIANTDAIADVDGLGAFSYQWQRSTDSGGFEDIPNATDQSYTLIDADSGQTLRVQISYTDGNNTDETVTSAVIEEIVAVVTRQIGGDDNDVLSAATGAAVTISGTVREGETLTADTGTLGDNDGLGVLSYQWQRGDGSGGFDDIPNATQSTYTLGDADVDQTVRVEVRYTDGQGTDETVTSDATGEVGNVNDMPTGSVTISGNVTEDAVLTADVSALRDVDGLPADAAGYDYQWQRGDGSGGFANIANATAQTYTLGDADAGQTVRVQVRYTDGHGTAETVTSDASAAVTNTNDDPTGAVTISGTVSEGETLTAETGTLDDNDGLGAFSYQWQRGDDQGGNFANIANATAQTYTLGDADAGQTVRVQVRYTDGQGTAETVTSDASAAVTNTNDDPTGAVTISGNVAEDAVLTADVSALRDADGLPAGAAGYSYQWQRGDGSGGFANIGGATARTYTLGDADVGRTVQVAVSYRDGNGTDETVTAATATAVGNENDDPTGAVTISGNVAEDAVLTADVSALRDADGLPADAAGYSYQWQRGDGSGGFANIGGATARTYTLGDADVGRTVQVAVSYRDGNGTDETVTAATATAVGNENDDPTGAVTISGNVAEDAVLTADVSALRDADGLPADAAGYSYQWQRGDGSGGFANIGGATARTYTLGDADVGQAVRVEVSYTDDQGTEETVTSDATAAVTNTNDLPTGSVTISGTVTEGETLTAQTGTLADNDGLPAGAAGYSYQWQRGDGSGGFANIGGATARTYTLGDADVGRTVQVAVSYRDGNGTDETVTAATATAVGNENDDPTGAVTISGNVAEDAVLTAETGGLVDNDGLGAFSYQWQRGDGSGGFANIGGATARTYTLGDADVGRTVQVAVSYRDGNGTDETVTSDATAAVTNVNDLPTGSVTISGNVTEDAVLTADVSALRDVDGLPDAATFTYQWQRNTGANGDFENIGGATQSTYTLGDADVGQTVRVAVSYRDGNGTDETVTAATATAVGNENDDPTGAVTISGNVAEDAVLTADVSALRDADGLPADAAGYSYQWQRGDGSGGFANIGGATARTYTLGDADVGRTVQVAVSYRDGNGTDETVTAATATAVGNENDDPTGAVTISGNVAEDAVLTADVSALRDADGLPADAAGYSYQWQRGDGSGGFANIGGATARTYTLGDADVGQAVRVEVSYTDDQGTEETVTSDATAAVTNTNDLPTGSVTISGTVTEGETLTAQTGTLADNDGLPAGAAGYSYQWQRGDGSGGFANIGGATARTYTLGDADVGRTVQVAVSYRDGNGTDETVTAATATAVGNENDDPTGAVTISGNVAEDAVLTAETGGLVDNDGLGAFSYQWQRGDGSGGFANIGGATARTYTLGDADVGRTVQVAVSYRDGNGTDETVTSDATAAVTNVNDLPTGSVTISGNVTEDAVLTADVSALRDVDGLPDAATFTYQWQRNTGANGDFENIGGATQSTYTLGDADVGQTVRVAVSYRDGNGTDETVTAATATAVGNENDDPTGAVTISGNVAEDAVLTADVSALRDADGLPADAAGYSYQWQRGDGSGGFANIGGATARTYTLGDADVGRTVQVAVSYRDGNGTDETVTSVASAVVTNVNDLPSGSVTISGTVSEGETLTAQNTLADNDGLGALSYQWQRSDGSGGFDDIPNATQSTYTLVDADVDQTVRVEVSYTDDNGTDESVTSVATAAVTNVNDLPTGSVAISGTVTEGETLTADVSALRDVDGLPAGAAGYRYQWQRGDGSGGFDDIPNATQSTYTLGDADVGRTVQVQVSYTDGQGTDESVTSDVTAAVENANVEGAGGAQQGGGVEPGDGDVSRPDSGNQNIDGGAQQGGGVEPGDGDVSRPDSGNQNIDGGAQQGGGVEPGDGDVSRPDSGNQNIDGGAQQGGGVEPGDGDVSRPDSGNQNIDGGAQQGGGVEPGDGDVSLPDSGNQNIDGGAQQGGGVESGDGDVSRPDSGNQNIDGGAQQGGDNNTDTGTGSTDPGGAVAPQPSPGASVTGTEAANELRSGDGNDMLEGLGGDDILLAINGDDNLSGGEGNDTLDGGTGRDTLTGDAGNDILIGDAGDDVLDGGAGNDRLDGGPGADTLDGGTGGNDTAVYSSATEGVAASLATGTGTRGDASGDRFIDIENLQGSGHDDTLTGNDGFNVLSGLGGDDILDGGSGNDILHGGAGDDTLRGSAGADILNGDDGVDTVSYGNSGEGVTISLGVGVGIGTTGDADGDNFRSIENLEGSNHSDMLTGNGEANALVGLGGDDTIDGGAGDDTLTGGDGDDVFRFAPGAGSDTITDFGTGTDRLEFTDGLFANLEAVRSAATETDGNLEITLSQAETETLTLEGASLDALTAETVTILDADGVDTTTTPPPSVRTIVGTSGNDVLTGSAGEDFLRGLAGNDQLTGGAGGDRLFGGAGRDNALYRDSGAGVMIDLGSGTASGGDAAGDTLVAIEDLTGSAFDDTLSGDAEANGLSGGSGDDRLNGAGGADLLLGGLGNDVLDGGSGRDALSGDEGDDTLEGGAGVDELLGGPGNDVLRGGDDTDRLFGGAGNTMLSGDGGADVLYGGVGDDTLSGGEGADVLNGLSGSNVLTGGAGSDVFVFFGDRAETRVTDFNPSEDRLSVLAGDAEGLTTGNDESGHLVIEVGETRATLEGVSAIDEISIDYRLESPLQDAAEVNERVNEGGNLVLEVVDTSVVLEGLSSLAGITIGYQQGDADHEVLVGSAGHDVLYGGGGNDVLSGGLSGDLVIGGSGHDVVYGGAAGDLLLGESGDDLLFGEGGADVIRGGAGSDILVGGDGDNVLQGGAGEDMFVVDVGAVGNERIVDFNLLEDSLVFLGLEPADRGLEGTAVEGGTLLTLSDEHTLLVVGVNPEDLGRMDVVFF